jgi:hypothetical protein
VVGVALVSSQKEKESILLEVLAELYRLDHQYSEALNIYLTQLDHRHHHYRESSSPSPPPPSNGAASHDEERNSASSSSEEEGGGGSQRVLELIRDHSLITEACVQKKVLQVVLLD